MKFRRTRNFIIWNYFARAGWLTTLPDVSHITLEVPEAQKRRASQTLIEAGARPNAFRLAVGAGASYGSAKCWPPDRFAQFANQFQSEHDADVILFGTPGELAVSKPSPQVMNRKPVDLTGMTAIGDLPALLSQCHLFLGNDSGAMHVAAAVGLPVVAVFGPQTRKGRLRDHSLQHRPAEALL